MEIGFENRLYEGAVKFSDYKDFFQVISNRRYTMGRVQRVLIHTLLGLTNSITEDVKKSIPYVRVLGFNSKGREYLSYLKKFENNKIITSYKK